jgi:hypothetical protein
MGMKRKAILIGLMFLSSLASAASAWDKLAGQSTEIRVKLCVVVRSQQEWGSLWVKHTGGKAEGRPAVDFSKEMVVAVFLGERDTGGYKVDVTLMADPIEPKTHLVVFYREIQPDSDSFKTEMISEPFVMVKIPRKPKVDFEQDGNVSTPEQQQKPPAQQSVFSPEQKMHIQKTMDGLQSLASDTQALFR